MTSDNSANEGRFSMRSPHHPQSIRDFDGGDPSLAGTRSLHVRDVTSCQDLHRNTILYDQPLQCSHPADHHCQVVAAGPSDQANISTATGPFTEAGPPTDAVALNDPCAPNNAGSSQADVASNPTCDRERCIAELQSMLKEQEAEVDRFRHWSRTEHTRELSVLTRDDPIQETWKPVYREGFKPTAQATIRNAYAAIDTTRTELYRISAPRIAELKALLAKEEAEQSRIDELCQRHSSSTRPGVGETRTYNTEEEAVAAFKTAHCRYQRQKAIEDTREDLSQLLKPRVEQLHCLLSQEELDLHTDQCHAALNVQSFAELCDRCYGKAWDRNANYFLHEQYDAIMARFAETRHNIMKAEREIPAMKAELDSLEPSCDDSDSATQSKHDKGSDSAAHSSSSDPRIAKLAAKLAQHEEECERLGAVMIDRGTDIGKALEQVTRIHQEMVVNPGPHMSEHQKAAIIHLEVAEHLHYAVHAIFSQANEDQRATQAELDTLRGDTSASSQQSHPLISPDCYAPAPEQNPAPDDPSRGARRRSQVEAYKHRLTEFHNRALEAAQLLDTIDRLTALTPASLKLGTGNEVSSESIHGQQADTLKGLREKLGVAMQTLKDAKTAMRKAHEYELRGRRRPIRLKIAQSLVRNTSRFED